MVHLPHLGKLRREVKEEVVDADGAAVVEASPFHKRSRLAQQQQQWSIGSARVSNPQPSQHEFLEGPSPLGLRLKKSPSLVDLIQMKLAQATKETDVRHGNYSGASDKLKASNFPGSVLRIGSWEELALESLPGLARDAAVGPDDVVEIQGEGPKDPGQGDAVEAHLERVPRLNRRVGEDVVVEGVAAEGEGDLVALAPISGIRWVKDDKDEGPDVLDPNGLEWVSRYEGDLVAKCYFAKHKLVWEVLDGGLKSKIEIQWSDISGIKMVCPENEAGTLEIVLSRQPLFFRETNPQPRKHTLWQATSDFTGGQASMHRYECPPGLMNKHMEKLVHCDPRLYSLSQQNDITLENPCFESRCSIFEDPEDMKCKNIVHKDDDQSDTRPCALLSSQCVAGSIDTEARQEADVLDVLPGQFTNSVAAGTHVIKQDAASVPCEPPASGLNWNGFRMPGIKRSMSKSEIVNHVGHQMFKQMYLGSVPSTDASKPTLDEFTQYLLSDSQIIDNGNSTNTNCRLSFEELTRQLLHGSQITNGTDENMLMSRVNSLCCLIQRDSGLNQTLATPGNVSGVNEMYERKPQNNGPQVQEDGGNVALLRRQESSRDLLTNLPRISSFPHFL
ncbi:hypothetical protein PR202_gb29229 [Eleusine coracana subsp. coracana]|uniref:TRF2/HOY1 PH-like domain-containing protein n=1 Tax=Eleusine coracana subsp. coracana TaxID=191504 RepID=A0AAV5FZR5_ELECO|nr:hypothetical protein PR202_gb29229 [Eleusine coracana subsp. coracana]